MKLIVSALNFLTFSLAVDYDESLHNSLLETCQESIWDWEADPSRNNTASLRDCANTVLDETLNECLEVIDKKILTFSKCMAWIGARTNFLATSDNIETQATWDLVLDIENIKSSFEFLESSYNIDNDKCFQMLGNVSSPKSFSCMHFFYENYNIPASTSDFELDSYQCDSANDFLDGSDWWMFFRNVFLGWIDENADQDELRYNIMNFQSFFDTCSELDDSELRDWLEDQFGNEDEFFSFVSDFVNGLFKNAFPIVLGTGLVFFMRKECCCKVHTPAEAV